MNNIKVVKAKYLTDYNIFIEFSNDFRGNIDLSDELWGKIFEPLKDVKLFKKFKLNPFTIYWDNGADFSPEFLLELARKQELQVADKNNTI